MSPDEAAIRAVLEKFWTTYGRLDVAALKTTIRPPVVLLQVGTEAAGSLFYYQAWSVLDRDLRAAQTGGRAGRAVKLSQVRVQMMGKGAASVHYVCALEGLPPIVLNTVLTKRRDLWRIVFSGVPM
jgi:hypothetical protein